MLTFDDAELDVDDPPFKTGFELVGELGGAFVDPFVALELLEGGVDLIK